MDRVRLRSALRSWLAPLSPRRRRWLRFLAGLSLDPDRLPTPLAPPSPRDYIICGAPRTGTTLLAAMLFQPPVSITVMEPWDGMRLAPADLFDSLRSEIRATGTLRRGKLDLARLLYNGEVAWWAEGSGGPPLDVAPDVALGVKWPAYWRFLKLLPGTRFLVCVRDPLEVVSSFKRKGGRLAEGLEYDIAFNRPLNDRLTRATDDPALRRVLLYEEILRAVLPYRERPNVKLIRYERWFSEPAALLTEIGDFLDLNVSAPRAQVRRSSHPIDLTPVETDLVRTHGVSARALGYAMGR